MFVPVEKNGSVDYCEGKLKIKSKKDHGAVDESSSE